MKEVENTNTITDEVIMNKIVIIRNLRVMIDADMAELYGVTTKRLNEAVKRNSARFPVDFMFQLTIREKDDLVANCDHLRKLKFSPYQPFAFTEHGAVMLASVLNSERAILGRSQTAGVAKSIKLIVKRREEEKIKGTRQKYEVGSKK